MCKILINAFVHVVSHNNEVFKWALHQELHIKRSNETNWVDMEIRTSPDALSEDETGFFDIYYMEIHPYRLENDVYGMRISLYFSAAMVMNAAKNQSY